MNNFLTIEVTKIIFRYLSERPENNRRFMAHVINLIIKNFLLGFINQLIYYFEE